MTRQRNKPGQFLHVSDLPRVLHAARLTLVGVLWAAMSFAMAQEQEPDLETPPPDAPSLQTKLLYVETPVAFEPALDPVLPEVQPPLNPEDDPEFLARMDSIAEYQATVETLEFDGGAWDQALVEQLVALGTLEQQQGDHAAAIPIFDRAIHINRINAGLHTLEQIPVVEKMIESHLALGNWEEADQYYEYLFYIQQRAYGPHDPRMIPVLDRLANWNIQAFNIRYGESLAFRLSTAQILLSAAASMVSAHFGEDDSRYIKYRRGIANSAFLVARHPELMAETQRFEYRNAEDLLLSKLDAHNASRPAAFQAGEESLREIVRHYAGRDDATYELAAALADLGDWYLMFARRRAAQDLYTEAWEILSRSEHAEEWTQQLFGQVVPIPTFANSAEHLLSQSVTTSEGNAVNYDYADVVFDVTVNGEVRNIEILSEANAYNSAQFSRLEREVRNSYFRPKVVNGEPVRSDRNYFRYRYWY